MGGRASSTGAIVRCFLGCTSAGSWVEEEQSGLEPTRPWNLGCEPSKGHPSHYTKHWLAFLYATGSSDSTWRKQLQIIFPTQRELVTLYSVKLKISVMKTWAFVTRQTGDLRGALRTPPQPSHPLHCRIIGTLSFLGGMTLHLVAKWEAVFFQHKLAHKSSWLWAGSEKAYFWSFAPNATAVGLWTTLWAHSCLLQATAYPSMPELPAPMLWSPLPIFRHWAWEGIYLFHWHLLSTYYAEPWLSNKQDKGWPYLCGAHAPSGDIWRPWSQAEFWMLLCIT